MSWFDLFNVAATHGKRDGEKDYPRLDQLCTYTIINDGEQEQQHHLPCYEVEQLTIAEGKISQISEKWEAKKHQIDSKLLVIEYEAKRLIMEYQRLSDSFIKSGMRRPHRLVGPVLYMILMGLLGIFEFPYNYDVMGFTLNKSESSESILGLISPILGSLNVEAIFVALGVSLSLLIMAHFVGLKLRQWHPKWQWKNYVMAIVTVLVALVVLNSLYHIREEFSLASQSSQETLSLDSIEETPSPKEDIPVKENNTGLYLVMLNVGFFVVGVGLSYFSHDEDRELERTNDQRKNVNASIKKLLNKREPLAHRYDTLLKTTEKAIEKIKYDALSVIAEYRDYNQKSRSSAAEKYPGDPIGLHLFRKHYLGTELDKSQADFSDSIMNFRNMEMALSANLKEKVTI